jgi:hypothetical protein
VSEDVDLEIELARARAKRPAAQPQSPQIPQPPEGPGALEQYLAARTTGGAALHGVGQGASMGFVDEIGGLVRGGNAVVGRGAVDLGKTAPGRALLRYLVPSANRLNDEQLGGLLEQAGSEVADVLGMRSLPAGYVDAARAGYTAGRDDLRRDDRAAREAHPGVHFSGSLAGGMGSPVMGPLGAIGKALPVITSPAGRLVTQAALLGGVQGEGSSESGTVGGQALDSLVGAGASALLTTGGLAARQKGMELLKKLAEMNAVKAAAAQGATIGNRAKEILGAVSPEQLRSFGRKMLDSGLVKFGDKAENIQERVVNERLPELGARYDDIAARASAEGATADMAEAAKHIESQMAKTMNAADVAHSRGARSVIDQVRAEPEQFMIRGGSPVVPQTFAQRAQAASQAIAARGGQSTRGAILLEMGENPSMSGPEFMQRLSQASSQAPAPTAIPFNDAWALKRSIGKTVYPNSSPEVPLTRELQQDAHGHLTDYLKGILGRSKDPELLSDLSSTDAAYSVATRLEKLAGETATRNALKTHANPIGTVAWGAVAGPKGAATKAVIDLLRHSAKERFPAALATSAEGARELIRDQGPAALLQGGREFADWLAEHSPEEETAARAKALRR